MRAYVAIEHIAARCMDRPGVARRQVTLSLLRQRKVTKRKATLFVVPSLRCGHTAVLGQSGVWQELACGSNNASPDPLCPVLLASSPRVGGGRTCGQALKPRTVIADLIRNPWETERGWIPDRVRDDTGGRSPNPNPFPHPVEAGLSSADGGGRSGQTCLSHRRVVWTAARVEQRRLPVAQRKDPDVGSPFFSLGFFGEAKKSNSPAGATPGLVVKGKAVNSALLSRGYQ